METVNTLLDCVHSVPPKQQHYVGKGEVKSKAIWVTALRDNLWNPRPSTSPYCNTFSVSAAHKLIAAASKMHSIFNFPPFIIYLTLYLESLYTHAAVLHTKPILPSINFCHNA